jgi:hypothetical protein
MCSFGSKFSTPSSNDVESFCVLISNQHKRIHLQNYFFYVAKTLLTSVLAIGIFLPIL